VTIENILNPGFATRPGFLLYTVYHKISIDFRVLPMKNKKHTPYPPHKKDKNNYTKNAAFKGVNSGTNKTIEENVNMPRGAESGYKEELLQKKTNQHI
jgi:hypothetical protein